VLQADTHIMQRTIELIRVKLSLDNSAAATMGHFKPTAKHVSFRTRRPEMAKAAVLYCASTVKQSPD
jgi:hypothetical protein